MFGNEKKLQHSVQSVKPDRFTTEAFDEIVEGGAHDGARVPYIVLSFTYEGSTIQYLLPPEAAESAAVDVITLVRAKKRGVDLTKKEH